MRARGMYGLGAFDEATGGSAGPAESSGVLSSVSGWLGGTVSNVLGSLKGTGVLETAGAAISSLVAKKLSPAADAKAKAAKPAKTPPAPAPVAKGMPGWVLPVAIGGGVLLLGTVVFAATRKK
jgi:hypothetical protein